MFSQKSFPPELFLRLKFYILGQNICLALENNILPPGSWAEGFYAETFFTPENPNFGPEYMSSPRKNISSPRQLGRRILRRDFFYA
jgi:hypothetical protein